MKSRAYSRQALPGVLRAHGIMPTAQRLQIAHALFFRGEHMSADQVFAIVNRRRARVSKATVYNTLNLFFEKKLVRQVLVDPGRVFYDPNVLQHYHVYDVDTGELTDIDASGIRVTGLPELPAGKATESVEIIVRVRSK